MRVTNEVLATSPDQTHKRGLAVRRTLTLGPLVARVLSAHDEPARMRDDRREATIGGQALPGDVKPIWKCRVGGLVVPARQVDSQNRSIQMREESVREAGCRLTTVDEHVGHPAPFVRVR